MLNNNEDDIKVTVLCLAYNHEKYIRATLEGFVSQKTNFKYEVIVHDDASTDATASIIHEYEEKHPEIIKPIYQKENQYQKGVNITKKFLLPNAKGKYIAYCEGDDYWCSQDKLQKQYDILEKYPECSIAVHKVKCCNEDGSPNERVIPDNCYDLYNEHLLSHEEFAKCLWIRGNYPFHTSSYFIRKSVHDEKVVLLRDIGLLKKAFIQGTVYYFDTPMSTRRLMSVNGFNYNMRRNGLAAKVNLCISDLENDIKFDEYTDFKYHSFIEYSLYGQITYLMWHDKKKASEYLLRVNLSYKNIFKYFSFIQKIKHIVKLIIIKLCPAILRYFEKKNI